MEIKLNVNSVNLTPLKKYISHKMLIIRVKIKLFSILVIQYIIFPYKLNRNNSLSKKLIALYSMWSKVDRFNGGSGANTVDGGKLTHVNKLPFSFVVNFVV